jgi:muramoyltetrapeptide carboxypeptidase
MSTATFDRAARLHPGDEIAVIATSSPLEPGDDLIADGLARSLGLVPTMFASVGASGPAAFLAGPDEVRAGDFEAAWCDDRFAAVWSARGGYGAARMLDLIDWERCRTARPKVLLGYSDVTCVHEAVATKLGLASLHAPMLGSSRVRDSAPIVDHLRSVLFSPDSDDAMDLVGPADTTTLAAGRAAGWVTGGNLSLLASTIGSRTALPSRAGAIAFLEDVTEEPYRIDGYLTSLVRSGWFHGVVGIALGDFTECGPKEDKADPAQALDVCVERLGALGVPILAGIPSGHGDSNRTLGLGVRAELDADAGTFRLTEPALR